VLCDIGLPGMDVYEVARTMRADPELRWIGLIAVSGYAQAPVCALRRGRVPADLVGSDRHLRGASGQAVSALAHDLPHRLAEPLRV
jgi:two-component system, sensor histidine kinase